MHDIYTERDRRTEGGGREGGSERGRERGQHFTLKTGRNAALTCERVLAPLLLSIDMQLKSTLSWLIGIIASAANILES
jgi:hypothetical protein